MGVLPVDQHPHARRRRRRGVVPGRLSHARPRRRRALSRREPVLRRRPGFAAHLRFHDALRAQQDGAHRRHALGRAVRRAGERLGQRHLHTAGRRQLRCQYERGLLPRRRQPAGQPARDAPGRKSKCSAQHLGRHHGERAGHAAADRCATPRWRAAPRRTRRPAAAGGHQERPAVDHAPDGGERQRCCRGQRRPERHALVRTRRAQRRALGGAVGHGVRWRGDHAAQLLDGRHHAQRAGSRGARHVARWRERAGQHRLHGSAGGRSRGRHGHAALV